MAELKLRRRIAMQVDPSRCHFFGAIGESPLGKAV